MRLQWKTGSSWVGALLVCAATTAAIVAAVSATGFAPDAGRAAPRASPTPSPRPSPAPAVSPTPEASPAPSPAESAVPPGSAGPPASAPAAEEPSPRIVRSVCTDHVCGGCDGKCRKLGGHVAVDKKGHCACTPAEGSALDRAIRQAYEKRPSP